MSGHAALHSTLTAWLIGGMGRTHLALGYRVADPIAIRVSLRTSAGWASWHVARPVIGNGLMGVPDAGTELGLARVAVSALPAVPPHPPMALVVLRSSTRTWPVTVDAGELGAFVAQTYDVCGVAKEQQIVDDATDVTARFFYINSDTGTR